MPREKKKKGGDGGPAWLVTFSDMMTLMLTFFVLLVSMATIDERRKLVVLESVSGAFGEGLGSINPIAPTDRERVVEPGVMDLQSSNDLTPLRDMLWEDTNKDLNFQENQYVQILSINEEVLFQPGTTKLSLSGMRLMDRILPWLLRVDHPLLIAGHTATMRAEEGGDYKVEFDNDISPTWRLSLLRSLAVYHHFTSRGIPHDNLRLEAFGKYRPRFSENTIDGRKRNRRVDIVLDKRNKEWIEKVERFRSKPKTGKEFFRFKDFRFGIGIDQDG